MRRSEQGDAVIVRMTQREYESALQHVFPGHYLDLVTRAVERVGHRAGRRVVAEDKFVSAVKNRRWAVAGSLFHIAAAREAREMPSGELPPGWSLEAEHVIQAGAGGSRADLLLRGPGGELVEFDWKTTGRSALSSGARRQMTRHAGQIRTNCAGALTTQESRSWFDFVRDLMPGVQWP